MFLTAILLATFHSGAIADAQRIAAKQAIERARYEFVLGDKPPFETRYPHTFFVEQLREEREREAVLKRAFGMSVTPSDLAREYDRIEKTTLDPEQWDAIKGAVHGDRQMIEEVLCRPLLVERLLRWTFDFDPKIHAARHEAARRARAEFLAGRRPPAAVEWTISRKADNPEISTLFEQAKREAALPRVVESAAAPNPELPLVLEPEALAVLERELQKPGDVSTILEYRDRFEVYRLLDATAEAWRVELVAFAKANFDEWLLTVQRSERR